MNPQIKKADLSIILIHECKWNLWCHHEIFEALHSHGNITQWTHTSTHIHTLMQQQANFTWPDTEIVAEQLSSFLALCSSLWCTTHKTKPEKAASLYSLTLQDLWVLGALGEEDTSGFKSESNRSRTQSCQSSSLWTFGSICFGSGLSLTSK